MATRKPIRRNRDRRQLPPTAIQAAVVLVADTFELTLDGAATFQLPGFLGAGITAIPVALIWCSVEAPNVVLTTGTALYSAGHWIMDFAQPVSGTCYIVVYPAPLTSSSGAVMQTQISPPLSPD